MRLSRTCSDGWTASRRRWTALSRRSTGSSLRCTTGSLTYAIRSLGSLTERLSHVSGSSPPCLYGAGQLPTSEDESRIHARLPRSAVAPSGTATARRDDGASRRCAVLRPQRRQQRHQLAIAQRTSRRRAALGRPIRRRGRPQHPHSVLCLLSRIPPRSRRRPKFCIHRSRACSNPRSLRKTQDESNQQQRRDEEAQCAHTM